MTIQQRNFIQRNRIWIYFLLAVLIGTIYMVAQIFGFTGRGDTTPWKLMMILRILMAGIAFWGIDIWLHEKEVELRYDKIVMALILAGVLMRVGYMLYTDCTVRAHDLGDLIYGTQGKAGYILYAVRGELPPSYGGELYQQPFYFMLAGKVSYLLNILLGSGNDAHALVDAAKTVSCFASCMLLIQTKRLLEILEFGKKAQIAAITVVAFTPAFYQVGGRVGENVLAACFMMGIIDYTLLWYKDERWQFVIMLAITYGFGMMTKLSCSMLCPFTIWIFVRKLRNLREKQSYLKINLQCVTFLIISIPIGLWYSTRNFIRFGQPFTYILPQAVEGPYFRGDVSFIQRFFSIDIANLFTQPYADVNVDANLAAYLLKSELFGEFRFSVPDFIPVILLLISFILTVVVYVWGISVCIKEKKYEILFLVVLFTIFPMYAYYSFSFSCSMNFRYFLMIAIGKGLLAGTIWMKKVKTQWEHTARVLLGRWLALYAIFSVLMYLA